MKPRLCATLVLLVLVLDGAAARGGRRGRRRRKLSAGAVCGAPGQKCADGFECTCVNAQGRRLFGAPEAPQPSCACTVAPSPPPLPPALPSPPMAPPPKFSANAYIVMEFDGTFAPTVGPSGASTAVISDPAGYASKLVTDGTRQALRVDTNILCDASLFQIGTSDFTLQLDMRRASNGGNSIAFQWNNGAGNGWLDLYNDYFWSAWQTSHIGTNTFDWTEWHTHAFVRQGGRAAYYIDGVQWRITGDVGVRNVLPTQVKFVGGFNGWVDDFELTLEAKYDLSV